MCWYLLLEASPTVPQPKLTCTRIKAQIIAIADNALGLSDDGC